MLTHGFTLSITFMPQRTQALPTTAFIVDSFVYLFTTSAFNRPLSANDSLLAQRLTGKRRQLPLWLIARTGCISLRFTGKIV